MPTIHYWPQKNKPQPLSHLHRLTLDGVTLQQGANEVSDKDYAQVMAHADTATLVEYGALEVGARDTDTVAIVEPAPLSIEQIHREAVAALPEVRGTTAIDGPFINERLADLQRLVGGKDWRSLKAIAEGHGIKRPADGWDAAVLPILVAEYGQSAAEEAYTQPE